MKNPEFSMKKMTTETDRKTGIQKKKLTLKLHFNIFKYL